MLHLRGHKSRVNCLAFSPDGRLLASAGADGSVRLWDVVGLRQRARFGHERVTAWQGVAFSPGGGSVAAASEGAFCGVVVWDPSGRELRRGWNFAPQPVLGLAYSPDGRVLGHGGRHDLVLWDLNTGADRRLGGSGPVRAVAWHPRQQAIATAAGPAIDLWEPEGTRSAALCPEGGPAVSVAWAPDGQALLSAGRDGTVCVWDPGSGRPRETFDWGLGKLNAVAVAPDGMTAAVCGADREVVVWDLL